MTPMVFIFRESEKSVTVGDTAGVIIAGAVTGVAFCGAYGGELTQQLTAAKTRSAIKRKQAGASFMVYLLWEHTLKNCEMIRVYPRFNGCSDL